MYPRCAMHPRITSLAALSRSIWTARPATVNRDTGQVRFLGFTSAYSTVRFVCLSQHRFATDGLPVSSEPNRRRLLCTPDDAHDSHYYQNSAHAPHPSFNRKSETQYAASSSLLLATSVTAAPPPPSGARCDRSWSRVGGAIDLTICLTVVMTLRLGGLDASR